MDDDRDLEAQAIDGTGTPRKRRAARGLRVPNDPVPTKKTGETVSPAVARKAPEDEFEDRPTELIEEGSLQAEATNAIPAAAPITAAPVVLTPALDLAALRDGEHSKTALDAPEAPPNHVEVLDELNSGPDSDEDEADVELSDRTESVEIPAFKPRSIPPPAPIAAAPSMAEESSVIVRHVRRKIIRAISDEPQIPDEPTIEIPTVDEVELAPTAQEIPPAPRPALSLPPPPPTASTKPVDESLPKEALSMLDEMESLDAKARPITAVEEPHAAPVLESMESEVVVEEHPDDATEEISIPDEILQGKSKPSTTSMPPAPPRASMPDGERPPPPPPPQQRQTIPDPSLRATQQVPGTKPKRRQWYEEIFNDDYLRTIPKYTPEQTASEGDFIEASLGVEKGATILDVGCGTGRQSVELASRGYDVMGLDLSLPMLSRASDSAQQRGLKINFVQADMGEIDFNEMFDAAFCVGSTYGFFDDDKNNDIIQRLHRALKPGGTLLLEVVNRDCAAGQHPGMVWYEGEGCVCMEETNFNWVTSRLEGKRTLLMEDGRQKEQKFSLRLYSLHELGRSLHQAGFRVIEVSGHPKTPGAFFGTHSNQLIILAQKRAVDS